MSIRLHLFNPKQIITLNELLLLDILKRLISVAFFDGFYNLFTNQFWLVLYIKWLGN